MGVADCRIAYNSTYLCVQSTLYVFPSLDLLFSFLDDSQDTIMVSKLVSALPKYLCILPNLEDQKHFTTTILITLQTMYTTHTHSAPIQYTQYSCTVQTVFLYSTHSNPVQYIQYPTIKPHWAIPTTATPTSSSDFPSTSVQILSRSSRPYSLQALTNWLKSLLVQLENPYRHVNKGNTSLQPNLLKQLINRIPCYSLCLLYMQCNTPTQLQWKHCTAN